MKLSTKPRHYCRHDGPGMSNKNSHGHHSAKGTKTPSRIKNLAMEIVRLIFGKMSRRTRRVYMEQERTLQKS